jgi:GDP-4-dehydro-6-deoxy-D-mannose reductase
VLLVGSATVYGEVAPTEPPIRESRPVRPTDSYSLAKAAAEMLAPVYEKHFPVVVARSFNHTGPGQGTDFALPAFASQIARIEAGLQEPVLRVGDLSAERDFLDVRDVVAAYALLLEHGPASSTVNVCSGICRPVSEWLSDLVAQAKVPIRVEVDDSRIFPQANPRLVGSNEKLEALGWKPRIAPKAMLKDLLEHWRAKIREA